MSKNKKIAIGALIIVIAIQFIRPSKNNGTLDSVNDISKSISVSDSVIHVLKIACYDCHSNYTSPVWYTNIQPIGWWINHHINEGKDELNFSEFNSYSTKKKKHKLDEIAELVANHEMPLSSYTWIHKESKLTTNQVNLITHWANTAKDSL